MLLFSRKKVQEAQGFMLKVVNNNCSELEALIEGPRLEGRVKLTVVVLVTPIQHGKPLVERTFAAVTKEFSTTGLSLVLNNPRALDEVILGFCWEADMKFVRAKAKHLDPMGAGFYQLGLQVLELARAGDYPELKALHF